MPISIVKATVEDIPTLVDIGRSTFYETFAESNTEEDMNQYLDQNFNNHKLHTEVSNPMSFYYIAWDNNEAIGYLKLNLEQAQTELQERDSIEIERIYVKKAYHGKKVGQLLYEQAIQTGYKMGKTSIWLGVWEQNPRAIAFYEKNGFVGFDKHIFKMGDDEQTDILMRKWLTAEP